ncbi:MAG: O-antigen ligase family protein [Bacteroidales bacterium]|nr:O-antigen ligase family protein [Bacteroidales bacterium]
MKWSVSINKGLGSVLVATGLLFLTYLTILEWKLGLLVAFLPVFFLVAYIIINKPYWGLLLIFVLNYFLMGLYRYINLFPLGLLTDFLLVFLLFSLLLRSYLHNDIHWKYSFNGGVMLLFAWLVLCILQLANPTAVVEAWVYTIRSFIYPVAAVIFVSILFFRYKDFKLILMIWSILTILAVIKMQWQVSFGFDSFELRWMYADYVRYKMVFLQSGIRYFSFFTDAGNFGSNMGCAMVVFSICAIYTKNNWLRIYYAGVGMLGMYAMFISGTRGALAVPFAGFFVYTLLSKNLKIFVISCFFLAGVFLFFTETYIGQGNQHIRRMRSAFDPNEPSLVVRKVNQKILANYLRTRPFGEGLGLAGVEARRFAQRITTQIPSDSWYVKIWCQTGAVGLVIYFLIYLSILAYGAYIILFRIRDTELRGRLTAIVCGLTGILASSYGNSIMGQYPTAILMATVVAFIFSGIRYDNELALTLTQSKQHGTDQLD